MRSRPLAVALAMGAAVTMLLGACATALPSSTEPASSSPGPTARPASQPSTPVGARLTVTGAGSVSGFPEYYGCMASFLIDPGPGTLERDATYDDPAFAVDRSFDACAVSGPAVGAPGTLAPGTYRVGGATSLISDVSSPGFARPQIMGESVGCSETLTVLPTTREVTITVTFTGTGCRLDVATR